MLFSILCILFISICCASNPKKQKKDQEDDVLGIIKQYEKMFLDINNDNCINLILQQLKINYDYDRIFVAKNCFIIHKKKQQKCYKLYFSKNKDVLECGEDLMLNIEHENICQVYHTERHIIKCDKSNTTIYLKLITMKYLNIDIGRVSFKKFREEAHVYNVNKVESHGELKNILFCVTKAIDCLQTNNLVHLDIKPENIMRYKTKGKIIYKLIDFQGLQNFTQDLHGIFRFSYGYQPPEAITDKTYNLNSDIWSLGMIAYYLSTGNFFKSVIQSKIEESEYFQFIMNPDRNKIIAKLNIDPKLKVLIYACLKNDPTHRASAKQLLSYDYFNNINNINNFHNENILI